MIPRLLILSALLCITYAYPTNYENDLSSVRDLNTAETVWDLFSSGKRGYSGWGTGAQAGPVVANPVIPGPVGTSYPAVSYGTYPNYASYGNNYYGKFPAVPYSGYASGFPTYENYAIHGGHGFGKYGKY